LSLPPRDADQRVGGFLALSQLIAKVMPEVQDGRFATLGINQNDVGRHLLIVFLDSLGDQLKGTPPPAEMLTSIVKTGIQMVAADTGISFTRSIPDESQSSAKSAGSDEAKQMAILGNAIANGLVTLAQATLSAAEIIHYAEPSTGAIQVLGSRLIITQSQAAHREIADLLEQLAE
jgi:hypothetical protein